MTVERITQLPPPPQRPDDAHKGTFGRVLIIGGSVGMSGAAALAGMSALRGGAGLVFVAVPKTVLPVVASLEASYLTIPLPDDDAGRIRGKAESQLQELIPQHDAVAVGPGIGRSKKLTPLVGNLFVSADVPMVVDADGLNALAEVSEWDEDNGMATLPRRAGWRAARRQPAGDSDNPDADASGSPGSSPARILTPHPGEFARLIGSDIKTVQNRREELAVKYASQNGVVLVLKGPRTLVTDGRRVYENTSGNCGLATGGTGDVLTGLTTALLGQGMPAFEAAHLGVYLHGLTGDLAADELSQPGMIASDVVRFLPAAWKRLVSQLASE